MTASSKLGRCGQREEPHPAKPVPVGPLIFSGREGCKQCNGGEKEEKKQGPRREAGNKFPFLGAYTPIIVALLLSKWCGVQVQALLSCYKNPGKQQVKTLNPTLPFWGKGGTTETQFPQMIKSSWHRWSLVTWSSNQGNPSLVVSPRGHWTDGCRA